MKKIIFSMSLVSLMGCGSEESDNANREYAQDVRQIRYEIRRIEVDSEVESDVGTKETLQKRLNFKEDASSDRILRLIDGSQFVLQINDQQARAKLSTAGNLEYEQKLNEKSPDCEIIGSAKISGTAENLKLSLDWVLDVQVKGNSCSEVMKDRYLQFQDSEVAALNMNAVADLIGATDQERKQSKRVKVRLRVHAEGF